MLIYLLSLGGCQVEVGMLQKKMGLNRKRVTQILAGVGLRVVQAVDEILGWDLSMIGT